MNPRELPLVGWVLSVGPNDPVFDSLLLAGPIVIAVLAALGRHPVSTAVAVAYLGAFPAYVLYQGVTE